MMQSRHNMLNALGGGIFFKKKKVPCSVGTFLCPIICVEHKAVISR